MVEQNWLLQTISDVLNRQEMTNGEEWTPQQEQIRTETVLNQPLIQRFRLARLRGQREWFSAIASLETLLLSLVDTSPSHPSQYQGLLLCGPTPILSHGQLISHFQTGIFTPEAFKNLALMPCQLPAAGGSQPEINSCSVRELPLLPNDPIAAEQFCLAFTAQFGLVMVLGKDADGLPAFQFSFEPETVQGCWATLRSRLLMVNPHQLEHLDKLVAEFAPPHPDYRLVTKFSRQLLKALTQVTEWEAKKANSVETNSNAQPKQTAVKVVHLSEHREKRTINRNLDNSNLPLPDFLPNHGPEVELLQALTHEIRTPLTTIRTLTKLLLRRSDLTPDILKLLETIDQECSEQINRMELILRAAELETQPSQQRCVQLTPISLEDLLQQSIPRWQQQAQRRNVILDVVLPNKLPQVVSNPAMLDQALTGVMEKFTRSLSTGGTIRVQVTTAGNQLKLQLLSQCNYPTNPLKSLGQLLTFQPETGSLSLNLDVTKNLFHALGGKLIVRQRPEQGEVLTIFLPLGSSSLEVNC